MKLIRILGLIPAVLVALLAFAATASATTFTSPTGTEYTGTLEATSTNRAIDGAFTTITCRHSRFSGTISSNGGAAVTGSLSTMDFSECNFPMTVQKAGTFSIAAVNAAGSTCTSAEGDTCRGTVTFSGTEISMETSVGTCVFTTSNTDVGTLTTTGAGTSTGMLDTMGKLPRTAGNFLCGSSGTMTGTYTIINPDKFWIDE